MIYAINERKGFTLISGDIGTGKTTLLFAIMEKICQNKNIVISIKTPFVNWQALLAYIGSKLNIEADNANDLIYLESVEQRLLQLESEDINVVLIIDEAHRLSEESLEQVRLLSNIEKKDKKLIQIVLAGQNEIYKLFERDTLRPLKQRVVVHRVLTALSRADTIGYIYHRLQVAGGMNTSIFTRSALYLTWKNSKGIPRVINQLCDNAMLLGYALDKRRIDAGVIREVLRDMEIKPNRMIKLRRFRYYAFGLIGLSLVLGLGTLYKQQYQNDFEQPQSRTIEKHNDIIHSTTDNLEVSTSIKPEEPGGINHLESLAESPAGEVFSSEDQSPDETENMIPSSAAEALVSQKDLYPVADDAIVAGTPWNSRIQISIPDSFARGYSKIIIARNDNITRIATRHYGFINHSILDLVALINSDMVNVDTIRVGQTIKLPDLINVDPIVIIGDELLYIYFGTHLNLSHIQSVRADLEAQELAVQIMSFQLGQNQAYRVFTGPYDSREEASQALNRHPVFPWHKQP